MNFIPKWKKNGKKSIKSIFNGKNIRENLTHFLTKKNIFSILEFNERIMSVLAYGLIMKVSILDFFPITCRFLTG